MSTLKLGITFYRQIVERQSFDVLDLEDFEFVEFVILVQKFSTLENFHEEEEEEGAEK